MEDMVFWIVVASINLFILAAFIYFLLCMGRIARSMEMLVKVGLAINTHKQQTEENAACPRCGHGIILTNAMEGSVIVCPKCKCEIQY